MTHSPPREYFSPSRELAPDLRDTEVDAEDPSNGLCNTGDFDHSLSENHDDLPTLEELLFNTGETNQSKRAGVGGEYKEELLEYTSKKDCDRVTTPRSRYGGEGDKPTALGNDLSEGYSFGSAEREAISGSDSSSYTSNRSTTDGRDDELNTPNT
ncbi:hypothetical protein MMC28_009964 [Mycoblastus sanguinarius]|nr:hypothetical protein [Mycoblastus sanguinarius]